MAAVRAIITDIEGTTSSLSFVKDVLFPYAREHLARFLAAHGERADVQEILAEADREAGGGLSREDLLACLIRWIDEDRKVTPLKALQGLIWQQGYADGDFKGHVYEDAVAGLRRWHDAGIRLYVYSSGSVQAQKLLFGHTAYGDLTPLFAGYFDTRIGGKRDSSSYRAILEQTGMPGSSVLFLSDVAEELDAAAQAGMQVMQLVRDAEVVHGTHAMVDSFDGIRPE